MLSHAVAILRLLSLGRGGFSFPSMRSLLAGGGKTLTFEEMPLEELADYVRNNQDDKIAHTIYVKRWNEREKLEFEASEKKYEGQ